jgi:hypothetical protein
MRDAELKFTTGDWVGITTRNSPASPSLPHYVFRAAIRLALVGIGVVAHTGKPQDDARHWWVRVRYVRRHLKRLGPHTKKSPVWKKWLATYLISWELRHTGDEIDDRNASQLRLKIWL